MIRFVIGSTIILSMLISCADRTFEQIPIYSSSGTKLNPDHLFSDSIQIESGLFYRQLFEKGYRHIFGYARVVPPYSRSEDHSYDLVFLSYESGNKRQRLICSIDPDFHSVIDVITYPPHQYRVISLQPSRMASTFIDIKLLDISVLTRRPDTLLVQANVDGMLDKIPLCCDF